MQSLKGHLLIASPKMLDPNFFRTVVLMIQHNDQGALGLILNRPLETTLKAAWDQVSETPCNVEAFLHAGGPCEGPLMVLHTHAADPDEELEILPGLHFTTDRDAIELLVSRANTTDEDDDENPDARPTPLKFFVGYAGWSPGQLEAELAADDGWLVTPATPELVFSDPEDLWTTTLKSLAKNKPLPGINPKCIPPDPSMN